MAELLKLAESGRCPECGAAPAPGAYEADGVKFPFVYGHNEDCTEWEELHCCPKCLVRFWFKVNIRKL